MATSAYTLTSFANFHHSGGRYRFLRPVVELGGARVAVPGGLLHVLQLRTVLLQHGRAPASSAPSSRARDRSPRRGTLSHHASDRVRVHRPARLAGPAVVAQQPEQRSLDVVAVPGAFQVCAQPCGRLRIDGESVASPAFAEHAEGVETPVLMQVADRQRGDFGAAQAAGASSSLRATASSGRWASRPCGIGSA